MLFFYLWTYQISNSVVILWLSLLKYALKYFFITDNKGIAVWCGFYGKLFQETFIPRAHYNDIIWMWRVAGGVAKGNSH